MGDSSGEGGKLGDSGVIELTGKIMVVTVLVLFLVVVFVFFLHLYAKWFLQRRQDNSPNTNTSTTTRRRRRRRFDFAPGYQDLNVMAALRRGLDPSVLKTIPVVLFSAHEFKDGLECAVCLSEVTDGEKIRLLPKCNHGFHVECIDMWFESHSTCPLCRNPVSDQPSLSSSINPDSIMESRLEYQIQEGTTSESLNFPTNVLFWGNETQVSTLGTCLDLEGGHQGVVNGHNCASSSSSFSPSTSNGPDGMLVIDIPRHANEDEEQKSPLPKRLRSLKRLLSRDRRLSPRSAAATDVDLEQQQGS